MSFQHNLAMTFDPDAQPIEADSFGARYVSLRGFDRFMEQIGQTDIGMVVWPGGSLAENDDDRYGIEFQDLYSGDYDRPGLSDLMDVARDEHLSLSIVLPTARYEYDLEGLRADASGFFSDLFSGKFGDLPDKLVLEFGNEFYSHFDGATEAEQASHYADVVNTYAEVLHDLEDSYDIHPDNIEYSIQLGRTEDGNVSLIEHMSDDAITLPDMLSVHRFTCSPAAADRGIDIVEIAKDLWADSAEDLGGKAPGLYLSAYNAASLSRIEAAEDFLSDPENAGLTLEDLDLEGRSHQAFEQHYQNMLAIRPLGMQHAETILQTFADYHAIGAEAAGVYGWDLTHTAASSYTEVDGTSHLFVGGQVQDMMAESLAGTRVLNWHDANDHTDREAGTAYAFDSEDKLVLFLGGPKTVQDDMTVSIDLRTIGAVQSVWAEGLRAEVPADWQAMYGIPDVEGVDQTPESLSYAEGIRETVDLTQAGNMLTMSFSHPDEIIRLVFARTETGASDIAEWSNSDPLQIDEEAYDELQAADGDAVIDASWLLTHEDLPEVQFEEETDDTGGDADDDSEGDFGALLGVMLLGLLALGAN